MIGKEIDGRAVAGMVKADISRKIKERMKKGLSRPGLDVILVGDNPASASYVKHKQAACKEVGIRSICHRLPETVDKEEITNLIDKCNNDPETHGILLQLPLPSLIKPDQLLERIDPNKDVDGFHPYNLGRLVQRRPCLRPCTPKGIMRLLEETGEDITGLHSVIVGASNIVGRPMTLELLLKKSTTTLCHRFTKNLKKHVQDADILITAIGNPNIVNSSWVKPGSIVIDVGFNRLGDGKIVGDVNFQEAKKIAKWITPVPGGVGQLTVAMLLENTLQAAEIQD